jgi:acetoacetyl-CoA synthetase
VAEGDLLWSPSQDRIAGANVTALTRWLRDQRGLDFDDYGGLWRWSVEDLDAFWGALWEYSGISASTPPSAVLGARAMPGAQWFPDARLNYAEHALRHARPGVTALLYGDETAPLREMAWDDLARQVRIVATQLRNLGVRAGDRVAAYLPNIPEAVVAMLATASTGAVWTSCSPDFGWRGALDRFGQLAPVVLFVVDGYQYAGRWYDRTADVARVVDALDGLRHVIVVDRDGHASTPRGALRWTSLVAHSPGPAEHFTQVPFDHPLWVLSSSGTTGLPEAIVHGHGGILIEHGLRCQPLLRRPARQGGRRARRAVRPVSPESGDAGRIAGVPGTYRRVLRQRRQGSVGRDRERWHRRVHRVRRGVPTLPVYTGEIQARHLGVAAHAFNDRGQAVIDEVGELVITAPMPSMPVRLWGDDDGSRYRETYFSQFPGVWCHGDFFRVNRRGGCFVLGRSDATLNRHGVRIGTAGIYRVLEQIEEVDDALVVNLDPPGGGFFMPLFVALSGDRQLDDDLEGRIRDRLRREYTPRHVPDRVIQVPQIPVTRTGKKMEIPVRRILLGTPPEEAANPNAMATHGRLTRSSHTRGRTAPRQRGEGGRTGLRGTSRRGGTT